MGRWMEAFFAHSGGFGEHGILTPSARANGTWNVGTIRGPAITLALSRALEASANSRPELRAVRATFDLHSPVPQQPIRSRSRVLRDGRRLMLVESELLVRDGVYARARGLYLQPTGKLVAAEPGEFRPPMLPDPPESALMNKASDGMLYWSQRAAWTAERASHQHADLKAIWFSASSLVIGEELTAFQLASTAADMSNLVINWGPHGVSEINADVSLSLARMPAANEVGVLALTRVIDGGISVGSAVLFDRVGAFGTTAVSSMPTSGDSISYDTGG